jgi:hypothetical protein
MNPEIKMNIGSCDPSSMPLAMARGTGCTVLLMFSFSLSFG